MPLYCSEDRLGRRKEIFFQIKNSLVFLYIFFRSFGILYRSKADSENICEPIRNLATNDDRVINTEKEVVTRMMVCGKQNIAQTIPQPELYTFSHINPDDPIRIRKQKCTEKALAQPFYQTRLSLENNMPGL